MALQSNETLETESSVNILHSKLAPIDYPAVSMGEYLAGRIAKHPEDALAFLDPNNNYHLTYGQLHLKVQEMASSLLALGLSSTDVLLFYAENSLEYGLLVLASIYLGLPYCPAPPASGPFELTEQIKGAKASVLIFSSEKLATIEKALQGEAYSSTMRDYLKVFIQLDATVPDPLLLEHSVTSGKTLRSFSQLEALGSGALLKSIPHFPVSDPATALFLVCFTSGTTGLPKAAWHTHRSFLVTMVNAKIGPSEFAYRTAIWHPLGHISGSLWLLHALDVGMTVVLFADSHLDSIIQAVPRLAINLIFFSPNQATSLANSDYTSRYDLSSLVSLKYGGSKIAESLLLTIKAKYGVKMWEMYGATEFMMHVRVSDPEETDLHFQPGNCGQLMPNTSMKIVHLQTGEPLGPYEHGEVCFKGPGCFAGYLENEAATRSTIVDGWYHSGDVGYYNDSGCLFISGRIKELIKYKLYSVFPAEIEDFLHRHPAVEAVCIVGVPHSSEGHYIRAYIQPVEGQVVTEEELVEYVKENMGYQKRLRAGVRFVDVMHRTLIGKVDRQYFTRLVKEELFREVVE